MKITATPESFLPLACSALTCVLDTLQSNASYSSRNFHIILYQKKHSQKSFRKMVQHIQRRISICITKNSLNKREI